MATLAPTVAAADKSAPLIPDWKQSHLQEADPAIASVYILAVCARNHQRAEAEAFLASRPGSTEEAALKATLMPSGETDCPIRPGTLHVRGTLFVRGAIAEALYNGDGIKPRADSPLPLTETFDSSLASNSTAVGSWVARCAVRRHPAQAHAVLKYNAGSPGEMRALTALRPVVDCLPAGQPLTVSRIVMRMLIAEELYRASRAFREAFRA
ncbi:MAG: hypothetical protein ACJ8ER_13295 [Allosphingosinicella sp.]